MNAGKKVMIIILGEIHSNYFKNNRINLIKHTTWILTWIVCETSITGAHTFYTDADKSGKTGYKSEDLSTVEQSPYNSEVGGPSVYVLLLLVNE